MNFLKKILTFLIVIQPIINLAQTRALVSPNSRFFAIEEFNGKKDESGIKVYEYEYKIYHLQSNSLLQSFILQSKSDIKPDVVKFSPDGKSFCVKQTQVESKVEIKGGIEKTETKYHILKIWDVRSGKLIKEDLGFDDIEPIFFNQSHYFLLITKDEMISYDTHVGKKIMDYKYVKNTQIAEAFVSSDDKYIVVSNNRGQSMVWMVGNPNMKKRITGSYLKFSNNMKLLTSYRAAGPNIFTYVYKIPSFERVKSINASKVLRDMNKKERDDMLKDNPDLRSVVVPTYKIDPDKSNFGPHGKYIVAYASREYKEPYVQERKLIFIEPLTGKAIYEIAETNDELSLYPYNWAGNNIFLVQTDSFNIDVLNLKAEQFVKNLELDIKYADGEKALNEKKQLKYRVVSANKRYVVMPVAGSDIDFYVKCTYLDEPKTLVKNLKFVGFSPNSRHLFAKTDKGEISVINTEAFEKTTGKTLDYNVIKSTPDSLLDANLAVFQEFKKGSIEKEDLIEKDSDIPPGYDFYRTGRMREMSTVGKGDILTLKLKTIEQYREKIGIQFNLMDNLSNLIQGAGSEEYKKIWSNLIVESPDGKISQIDDFTVTEYSETDSIETAIALVLDHSGSIGNDRAKLMQQGALEFIKNKSKLDGIAIVKYDQSVGVESELRTDKKELIKQLEVNGIGRFGGSSSLIDGINEGISLVNNASNFHRKAVIVLTDGQENTSYLTKNELVSRAIQNNISIHIIAIGNLYDKDYLQGISNNTEGSFFQLYDRRDFRWIYEDIYKRMKNYYAIRFNASLQGKYKTIVDISPAKVKVNKLVTEFDYTPNDLEKVSLYFDAKDAFVTSINSMDTLEVKDKKYRFKPISNFDKILIKNPMGEIISEETDTTGVDFVQVEEEFQSIVFPDIKFEYNNIVILEGSDSGLEDVADFLKENPKVVIEIGGHTDDMGDPKTNQDLSQKRAINVKKRLLDMGVDADQVETVGYGDSKPIMVNDSEENRSINRRVEFKIINIKD